MTGHPADWPTAFLTWWERRGPSAALGPRLVLPPPQAGRRVGFGDHAGEPVWTHPPARYRRLLRRLLVTQADSQAGGIEQTHGLERCAPSQPDRETLVQLQLNRGRQLLGLVDLLQQHFGAEGNDEAFALLERTAGDPQEPRILDAFNEIFEDWPSFLAFDAFASRLARFQLGALAESGFDPLARLSRSGLAEQDRHIRQAQRALERLIRRSASLAAKGPVREQGGVDLQTVQKLVNQAFASCLDLFGSEVSSNAAEVFAAGLKGRWREADYDDHIALEGTVGVLQRVDGALVEMPVPLRMAMNLSLRQDFVADSLRALYRWNQALDQEGSSFRLQLPSPRFFRRQGLYMADHFDPEGLAISQSEWEARSVDWLPTHEDRAFLRGLMQPCPAPGQVASWTTSASPPGGS